jgi:hypothetical protein
MREQMNVKAWFQIAAVGILLVVSTLIVWHTQQIEQAQLQAKLKSAEEALAEATARQATRDAELQQRVAQLEKKKAEIQKPADVLKALPEVLSLPTPLVMEAAEVATPGKQDHRKTSKGDSPAPKVLLPVEDLKPLYDAAVECKECQAKLAVAAADLKDEKAKTATLTRERDDALRVAKGGSVLRRVARAAKWFVIGAAVGAAAAKLAR